MTRGDEVRDKRDVYVTYQFDEVGNTIANLMPGLVTQLGLITRAGGRSTEYDGETSYGDEDE